LSGSLTRSDVISQHIAATLLEVFDDVYFVDNATAKMTFAIAGVNVPFNKELPHLKAVLGFAHEWEYLPKLAARIVAVYHEC